MTQTTKGWIVFIGALGLMMSLMAVEVANLESWTYISTPIFVGKSMAHLGTVIAAFVGGKLLPNG